MPRRLTMTFLAAALWLAISPASAEITGPPDPTRVEFFAKILPEKPRGLGAPISDRKAWEDFAKRFDSSSRIEQIAEAALATPMPEMTDDLYLDYSRTGNRERGQAVIFARRGRMRDLVLAECLTNQGRYLPAIEESIQAIAGEKSWLYPAHDGKLINFHGEVCEIDLAVADLVWQLATADYWLGDKLSPATRKLIADELERRCFQPFEGMVNHGKPRRWWLNSTHNWNAVCLAGVIGAALEQIDSRYRRAYFVAAAEKYIESFLSSYKSDGFCTEGIGYWSYGFGNFIKLAETVKQATGGKVDWMSQDRVKPMANFARGMEILPGVNPAFGDCDINPRPDRTLMACLNQRYGWGLTNLLESRGRRARRTDNSLFDNAIFTFPNSVSQMPAAQNAAKLAIRDYFPDGGVLICRPKSADVRALGAALKGGDNAEVHNHNDVGSFVVAIGKSTPIIDPGAEIYTARTFSVHRYDSNVLNSFGHSVPRVAGQLQAEGAAACGKVMKAEFTEAADTWVLDMAPAYPVPSLEKLVRTFVFSREGTGKLTVSDEVEFTKPEEFGTALVTLASWKKDGANRLQIGNGADAVSVEIAVEGGDYRLDVGEIKEDLPGHRVPIRLGIDFTKPVTKAKITTIITPK